MLTLTVSHTLILNCYRKHNISHYVRHGGEAAWTFPHKKVNKNEYKSSVITQCIYIYIGKSVLFSTSKTNNNYHYSSAADGA